MNELIASAENGDAKSQYRLAVLYHDGKVMPKDYVQAAYWYRKAAEQGHMKAQLYLGLLYFKGYGVPHNYDEAVRWLTLSSEQGSEKAKILLEDVIAERDSESESKRNETHSPSKVLIFITAIVIILAVIVISSAHYFMNRTERMLASIPVMTLPSNEDDTLYPPVNPVNSEYHSDSDLDSDSLLSAIMNGNASSALELLNHNADPNYIDENSLSVMQNLIIAGGEGIMNQNDVTRIIIAMLKNGADINYHTSISSSLSSCTPLSLAIQYDMPEAADVLIESNADMNIKDSSGKTASDYARELRNDSELKKSPVYAKLTESSRIHAEVSDRNVKAGRQQAEKLLKAKRISPFVRDTGTFEFNPDYEDGTVEITGSNVRMRKQPNTKSRTVKTVNRITSKESLKYLGEWTSPQGDKWVVCAYKDSPKVRDVDAKIVWIFGEYIRLIAVREKESMLEGNNVN